MSRGDDGEGTRREGDACSGTEKTLPPQGFSTARRMDHACPTADDRRHRGASPARPHADELLRRSWLLASLSAPACPGASTGCRVPVSHEQARLRGPRFRRTRPADETLSCQLLAAEGAGPLTDCARVLPEHGGRFLQLRTACSGCCHTRRQRSVRSNFFR
jgi:hypothetical protein